MATDTYRAILELDARGMAKGERQASASMSRLEGRLDRAEGAMGRVRGAGAGLGRMLGALGLATSVGVLVRSVVGAGAEFEVLGVQLETVTGSAARADVALSFIKEFAASTPFQVRNITDAFVGLKARGFDPTAESMKALGDLGAAFGKDITTSMQAVTQAAFGEGEMLKQFGIIMRQRGDEVSLTYKGVTKTVEKESQAIFGALIEMAQQSDGAMERMSLTLTGRVSTMKDAWANFADALSGSGINDALKKVVTAITKALNFITNNFDALSSAVNTSLAEVVEAFGTVIAAAEEVTPVFAFLLDKILPDLTSDIELMAEGLRINAAEALERAASRASNLNDDLSDLNQTMAETAEGAGAVAEQMDSITVTQNALEPVRQSIEVFGRELADVIIDSLPPAYRAGTEGKIAPLVEKEVTEGASAGMIKGVELSFGEKMKRAAERFGLQFADAMAEAVISGDVAILPDAFADMGRDMGGEVGKGLTEKIPGIGKFLAPLGDALGQAIGNAIGNTVGKAISSLLVSLGLAPDPKRALGSFAIGPGGFTGVGGTPETQATANRMLDQIDDIFKALNEALAGTVDISQNMLIEVRRDGAAILQILDTATGAILSTEVFGTVQDAVDAGLSHLLSTAIANASGPLTDAFQEILGQAATLGAQGVVDAFQSLAAVAQTIATLGGPVDLAVTSIEASYAAYDQARAAINALNVSVETTAGLMADLDQRFQNFQEAAQLGVLSQLADMAERFGLEAEFVKEVRLAEVELQFKILEATLIAHGIWEENQRLFDRLQKAAVAAANAIGEVANRARGSTGGHNDGVLRAPPGGLPVLVNNPEEIGAVFDQQDYSRRLREAMAPFRQQIANIGQSGFETPEQAAASRAWDELEQLFINWGVVLNTTEQQLFVMAEVLEIINPKIVSAFESLERFRRGLDTSAFAPGSNADRANTAMQDFLDLLAAAEGGDLGALEALPDAANLALQLASEAFGTSTDAFEAIFSQITIGLDRVLGNQDSITLSIQQQQLDALGLQSDLIAQSLVAQNQQSDTLREILAALQSGALQQSAAV